METNIEDIKIMINNTYICFILVFLLFFLGCNENKKESDICMWLDKMPPVVWGLFDPTKSTLEYKTFKEWYEQGSKYKNIEEELLRIYSKDHSRGLEIAFALKKFGSVKSASVLIHIYQDNSQHVYARSCAAVTLGEWKISQALKPLCETLLHTDNNLLAMNTIIALGELGNKDGVPAVIKYTEKNNILDNFNKKIINDALINMGSDKLYHLTE
jgi:hypothetical protein